jgi:hypothetical protein
MTACRIICGLFFVVLHPHGQRDKARPHPTVRYHAIYSNAVFSGKRIQSDATDLHTARILSPYSPFILSQLWIPCTIRAPPFTEVVAFTSFLDILVGFSENEHCSELPLLTGEIYNSRFLPCTSNSRCVRRVESQQRVTNNTKLKPSRTYRWSLERKTCHLLTTPQLSHSVSFTFQCQPALIGA